MNNNDVNRIINAIINSPQPNYTREYAQELLRSCGILDDNNEIVPIYRDIIKCKCHNWAYIGLDEYRCTQCGARSYT